MRPLPARAIDDRVISGKTCGSWRPLCRGLAPICERIRSGDLVDPRSLAGGRAATTGGWASVASSALLSFDVSGVLAALVSEAVTGFDAVMG